MKSDQSAIDRGWDPGDVSLCLQALGFQVDEIDVRDNLSLLASLDGKRQSTLVWPVCYTLGEDPGGPLLVKALEANGIPFVGPGSRALSVSSKLALKNELDRGPVSTPRYIVVGDGEFPVIPFGYPCVLKCEYTCDSRGVELATSCDDARKKAAEMMCKFRQRVFIEEWVRNREFTVAFIPDSPAPVVAALELKLDDTASYINCEVKQDNRRLTFLVPSPQMVDRLASVTIELAEYLGIDGHFRVDILEDARGSLHVIDINFLPQMHFAASSLSYFPMAFILSCRSRNVDVVCAILDALSRTRKMRFAPALSNPIRALTCDARGSR